MLDQQWGKWRLRRVHLVFRYWWTQFGQPAGGPTSRPGELQWDITNYKGSPATEMEPCRYWHCTHSTSKSAPSIQGHCATTAQMPNLNHQHITWVWPCTCTGTSASQGWWSPECSSTKGRWRSQHSTTTKRYIWRSEMVHGGIHIHNNSLGNDYRWEELDGWWSWDMNQITSGSSVGISRSFLRYTICVSIARWSIC